MSSVRTFVQLALQAMKRVDGNNRVNLVPKFCQGLVLDRPDRSSRLITLHCMTFGLIRHCIEFFTCTNVRQVTLLFLALRRVSNYLVGVCK